MATNHKAVTIAYYQCLACETKWGHKNKYQIPKCPKCGDTANLIVTASEVLLEAILPGKESTL